MRLIFTADLIGIAEAEQDILNKQRECLWLSMTKMTELAIAGAPFDRGLLASTIKLHPVSPGKSEYTLADGVEYGADLEYGNTPRPVKFVDIEQWVIRKGIRSVENAPAFAKYVTKKIRERGVNAQPFFRPARAKTVNYWVQYYWQSLFGQG